MRRTVTDLIHCLGLIRRQLPVAVDGVFFEEVADLIARVQEIVVTDVVLVRCREFRLPPHDDVVGLLPGRRDLNGMLTRG